MNLFNQENDKATNHFHGDIVDGSQKQLFFIGMFFKWIINEKKAISKEVYSEVLSYQKTS